MRRQKWVFFAALAVFGVGSAGCGGGQGTPPPPITIAILPATATVQTSLTQQFAANLTGTTNTAVTWAVVGGAGNGAISASGLYTAPASVPSPAVITIRATSQANATKTATALVTVVANNSGITVDVSPTTVTMANFTTQQFIATVAGTNNTEVTWAVNGTPGGTLQFGFISSTGFYQAPGGSPVTNSGGGSVSDGTTIAVTAISQANAGATGSARVTLLPANQTTVSTPVPLGTSGGNANDKSGTTTITCCAGTLGSLVTRAGTQYILSNNHVLARSDAGTKGSGPTPGDAIIEPGLIDSPNTCFVAGTTTVANLSEFFNLETDPVPNIDAALAQVVAGKVDPSGKILYLGETATNGVPDEGAPHQGTGVTVLTGRAVAKSGRSTGLTCSTVLATNVSTSVEYSKACAKDAPVDFTVSFTNQIDVAGGTFSAEGDSGSLIVTQDTADPVALLFAGSDSDTVGNPVQTVLNFFKDANNNTPAFVGTVSPHQVIGCTLPMVPVSANTTVPAQMSDQALQKAIAARDAEAARLMGPPEVEALGVGQSYDDPGHPAILFFVAKGQGRAGIPEQVNGVRTRIVEGELFSLRGKLTAQQSAAMEKSAAAPRLVYSISDAEFQRAKTAHTANAAALMKKPGIQGVGIGSSVDAPGEAALVIFTVRGAAHPPIPPEIDGVRTRIRETSRFRAGNWNERPHPACAEPKALRAGIAHHRAAAKAALP